MREVMLRTRSDNDEIEIFEDDEVTAEEKNKATCDLHDLGIPVYGRPKCWAQIRQTVIKW
jgi:hypothetical protein